MKRIKLLDVVFFLLMMILLCSISQESVASPDYGISSIHHSPEELVFNQNITVTIEFYDDPEIDLLKLLVCQISPEFQCDPLPTLMEQDGNSFTANYTIHQPINSTVGYHFQIIYSNASYIILPSSSDFLSSDNIIEVQTGVFYFLAGTVLEHAEENSGLLFSVVFLGLMVFTLLKKRRKK